MTGLQLTRRQYYALCTMVLLSPLLHLVPRKTTAEAGCCGWLCALVALVPLLLFAWMLEGILHRGRPGEGIGEITLRALGPVAGRVLLGVYALWFLLYSAFALRIGAERFIETVFPLSRPWPFVVTILAMAVCGALGRTKALFRASEIFLPLLMLVLVLVLVFAAASAYCAPSTIVTSWSLYISAPIRHIRTNDIIMNLDMLFFIILFLQRFCHNASWRKASAWA